MIDTKQNATECQRSYKVLLEHMTPTYTMVTVTAGSEQDAAAQAERAAYETGHEWQHDRLPGDGVWSIIPPVGVAMPTDDGPPSVIGVFDGDVETNEMWCWTYNVSGKKPGCPAEPPRGAPG